MFCYINWFNCNLMFLKKPAPAFQMTKGLNWNVHPKVQGKQTNQNTSWASFKLPLQSFPVNQSPHSHEYCAGLSEVLLQVPPFTHGLSTSHIVCATKEKQIVQFLSVHMKLVIRKKRIWGSIYDSFASGSKRVVDCGRFLDVFCQNWTLLSC